MNTTLAIVFLLLVVSLIGVVYFLSKPKQTCTWNSSEWSSTCYQRQQTRTVSCLDTNGKVCDKCLAADKPREVRACEYCCDDTSGDNPVCTVKVGRDCGGDATPVSDCQNCKSQNCCDQSQRTCNPMAGTQCDDGGKPISDCSGCTFSPQNCCNQDTGSCTQTTKAKCDDGTSFVNSCSECNKPKFCCDRTVSPSTCIAQTEGNACSAPSTSVIDCKTCTSAPDESKWGKNVYFFSEGDTNIQSQINDVFKTQGGKIPENNGQFSLYNYALLFMPGNYKNIDIPVGYYTHVAGLGRQISDVVIDGGGPNVDNSSEDFNVGSLNNFWRSCENMKIVNPGRNGVMIWSVSQAASLRSMDIEGDLMLFAVEEGKGGFASGGYISNTKAKKTTSGSQQQFICRNCEFDSFEAPLWNQVLVGCILQIPAAECCLKEGSGRTLLSVPKTPLVAEKPFLVATDPKMKYTMSIIKPVRAQDSSGQSEAQLMNLALEVPESGYFIAKPGTTSAIINTNLKQKKDIVFCPGIYSLDDTLHLSGQLLFGLGLPRITTSSGKDIVDGFGDICGIIFEAASGSSFKTILVNMNTNTASNLWDVYCRVGGGDTNTYSADTMLFVGGDNSIVDNSWCWVADHNALNHYTGWDKAVCDTGVHVTGESVTCYGIFSEHNHNVNLNWSGNKGEMYMFQSEFNYFPKTKESFKGAVSYRVDPKVTSHKVRGAGAYCFFPCSDNPDTDIFALAGFMFPGDIVDYKTVFTVYLNGYGGIRNVIVDETGKGDNLVVEWVTTGKMVEHPQCMPSFTRASGSTMLKYRCPTDSCACVPPCISPSICAGGQCKPVDGCSPDQQSSISKACPNGCACGTLGSMWKCTTKNQMGCYSEADALSMCGGTQADTCQWF